VRGEGRGEERGKRGERGEEKRRKGKERERKREGGREIVWPCNGQEDITIG